MSNSRKGRLMFFCLPLALMLVVVAAVGDHVVHQYPVERRLDVTVLAALGAVLSGVLLAGWWARLSLDRLADGHSRMIADAQQVMHDYAWLPVAFTLVLSTALFVMSVAALTGTWYVLDRLARAERDREAGLNGRSPA